MGFYSQIIFPRLCEFALNREIVERHRQELLASAYGEVLEIGFGTGLNLPHYPASLRKLTTADPNPGMHRFARKRVQQTDIEIDQRVLGGEQLPFDDEAFDCVVSTFTLCSIDQVNLAVGEVYRVLKSGGRFLLLEHGLSPEANIQKWQRRLNWLEMRLGDGCHLDRNIKEIVAVPAFSKIGIEEFYLERTPKTHGYLYRGSATK
ncbi:MAG: class I SAM-dependent methyltransferase [Planctomycetaceae bacterium]|nr:class I SAM-dependent methyltransferase [Planctomycetaceae bacterium]